MAQDNAPRKDFGRGDPYTVANASRIYFLPNLLTAGNLFCGFFACLKCIEAAFIRRGALVDTGVMPHEAIILYKEALWMAVSLAWADANRSLVQNSIRLLTSFRSASLLR